MPKCDLIREALTHVKKQHQGVSLIQIRKHLEATYQEKMDSKKKKFIVNTFKTLIQEGKLLQKGSIYKSTKKKETIRDVPRRKYCPRRYYRKSYNRRRLQRRRQRIRRRCDRRGHHVRKYHKVCIQKAHRQIKGRRGEGLVENPDYTNSVPSVEVSNEKLVKEKSTSRRSKTSQRSRT